MPLSYADHPEAIEYIINRLSEEVKLNDWEKNFISNIKTQFSNTGSLSSKQKQTLSLIWEKY